MAGVIKLGLGVGGSLLMAVWDFRRMGQEFGENNVSAGIAFGVSGVLGAAATVLLLIGWTGWGLIVVAAMIAWALIVMPLLKVDNTLQDWLERCLWGNLTEQRYADLDIEMKELKAALKV